MSDPVILARSKPRNSYMENGYLYKEWAIYKVETQEERDNLVRLYCAREIYKYLEPFVLIRRIVRISVDEKSTYNGWDIIGFAKGELDAARSFADTEYWHAESVDPLHVRARDLRDKSINLNAELNELQDKITPNKFQRQSNLELEYQDRFYSVLKTKRLYKKVMNNDAPQDIIDQLKIPLVEEYKSEYKRILTRIDEIKKELEAISVN